MRTVVFIIVTLLSYSSYAYDPIDILPQGSRVSLVVKTPKETILSINSEQLFAPASTLKVVTALAAKLELGDQFHFKTQLESKEQDIIVRFTGDPTLTTKELDKLIAKLPEHGITHIKGNIWLNNSAFSGYERGIGWPWDILGVCYSAPASAITLDSNCVQASIYTNEDGTTRVYVPAHQPIEVQTKVIAVSKAVQKQNQCELELTTFDSNKYLLSGCLVHQKKPLPLKFAVQETHIYTESILRTLLAKHNIRFDGDIKLNQEAKGTVIASHSSDSLDIILEKMLTESNNLIADNTTKTLGSHFYSQPGSFNNGTEAIKQIIYSNTGIDLREAQLADGSGLSRNNRITAVDLSRVLDYIWQHDDELNLISMLPIAGENGTLKYRKSMRKAPIKGRIQAKSGSLYGSYNMAGYSIGNDGKPNAIFVQFVNDYYPKKSGTNSNLIPPIYAFEKVFFKDLLKQSLKNN